MRRKQCKHRGNVQSELGYVSGCYPQHMNRCLPVQFEAECAQNELLFNDFLQLDGLIGFITSLCAEHTCVGERYAN